MAGISFGAGVCEPFPRGPGPGDLGGGAVHVVVWVPAGEFGAEHEVDAVFLDDSGGFDGVFPEVGGAFYGEVVVGEEVDAEAVFAL